VEMQMLLLASVSKASCGEQKCAEETAP